MVDSLFRAYFTEGRDIGNQQALIDVVAEAGLDRGKAQATLNCSDGLEVIREANELSRRFRVDGVPFFIFNGQITLAGVQNPDTFLASFRETLGPTLPAAEARHHGVVIAEAVPLISCQDYARLKPIPPRLRNENAVAVVRDGPVAGPPKGLA